MIFEPPNAPQHDGLGRGGTGRAVAAPEFSRPMTCERLREWVTGAQTGAIVAYSRGFSAASGCREDVRRYVLALHELGYVCPHVMRGADGVLLYVVRRSARGVKPGVRL